MVDVDRTGAVCLAPSVDLMLTWESTRELLRTRYALDDDGPDSITLTLPLTDGRAARAQRVMVQHYVAWGHAMLELRSAFGELADGEAQALLEQNLHLPFGAVAVHGRFLVLVHKTPLDLMSEDGVLFMLTRVGELADVLEERRGGDRF